MKPAKRTCKELPIFSPFCRLNLSSRKVLKRRYLERVGVWGQVAGGSIGLSFNMCYLQLQDPECLTSRRTPKEQAACFMAHSLGYVVLSLAHTASSERLSGHESAQIAQRPRPILASQRHFFPALQWMSSHDLASKRKHKTGTLADSY